MVTLDSPEAIRAFVGQSTTSTSMGTRRRSGRAVAVTMDLR